MLVEFTAERIETWNTPAEIVPDSGKGLWAAVLTRKATGWREDVTVLGDPSHVRMIIKDGKPVDRSISPLSGVS